jgi:hypothetical protein
MKARLKRGAVAWRATAIIALVGGLTLAACGRATDGRAPLSGAAADSDADYAAPPTVLSAQRLGDQVMVTGRGQPNSRLRLQTPDGQAFGGTSGADGAWTMPAPAPDGPRLYAVAEEVGGRIVRAEGYLAALPSGRPAAILRAGLGAQALGAAANRLQFGAVDYDSAGWAYVSGMAPPLAILRLQIDGQPPLDLKADSEGRFSQPLKPAELAPGSHHLAVVSANQTAKADIAVSPTSPISGSPYQGRRQGAAWRIDWRTPGGGMQTSLILDP